MVTAVICMLLRRYVLHFLSTLSIDFRGKRFDSFREHASCNLLCRRLIDSDELSSTFLLVTISRISHLFPSFSGFRHSEPPLLRESYVFVQRHRFLHQFDRADVSPFSKLVVVVVFLMNNDRRDN